MQATQYLQKTEKLSDFEQRLEPIGRILETDGYDVWGCSPIYGPDGRCHVFYSRWKNEFDHLGWVAACEIGHAVADTPEGPFKHVDVALKGRGGDHWDSWSIHNPTVHKVGDKYAIFYMGSDGSHLGKTLDEIMAMGGGEEYLPYFHKLVQSKRVGMAIADSLDGPWERVSEFGPMVQTGGAGNWDDLCTSNPAFMHHPNGECWLYYKGWDYESNKHWGNRKYGLAIADSIEGPYKKFEKNPVISFAHLGPEIQCEDGYFWFEDGEFHVILRDMGFYNHEYGLLMHSEDGIHWSNPEIAYKDAPTYFDEDLPGLDREGRFERPQILLKDGKPDYLFCAYRGGKYNTSSGVVFKINPKI